MSAEPKTVVLVHGAWGGTWSWERVVPLLAERGVPSVTVDLPSVGCDPHDPADLGTDAEAVTAVLDGGEGSFVLCGHSYGGMVITRAGAGRSDVAHLVYLCAFMPEEDESLFELTGGPAPWIDRLEDGRVIPDLERAARVSYSDCDPETAANAVARLRPQVTAPFAEPVGVAAWHQVPSTYVVCSEDQSLPPEVQRDVFAPRAGEVVELRASHAAMFSQPERIAELLAERARRE